MSAGPQTHTVAGRRFDERMPRLTRDVEQVPRVVGAPERDWPVTAPDAGALARARARRADELLAVPSPLIEQHDPVTGTCVYTWVVQDRDATAVLLCADGVLDHTDIGRNELVRLPGSDLWTISYRLPGDWRASYVITRHADPGPPPWRVATERRAIRLAAMAGRPDPRNPSRTATMRDDAVSIVHGPAAPAHPWRTEGPPRHCPVLELAATDDRRARRVWLYDPEGVAPDVVLPLVIVFDGQVWAERIPLPDALDAAIAGGLLPPLRAVLVDSGDVATRWDELGVPGGTTTFVLDELLPAVRALRGVTDDPTRVVATGASFGGLAALWLLALGSDQVGAAVAQSPSLWRFDMHAPLRALVAGSVRVDLQAGVHEGDMLADARALHRALLDAGHVSTLTATRGGHDWAWWFPGMIDGLARVLRGTDGTAAERSVRVDGLPADGAVRGRSGASRPGAA